ncbi:glycosyltransferase [Svornostia abyssi]|uniref:Glycosyltransferase n=1 Tax=Svornostia abyssi TaxID=2898438 RepID=A0ABY5PDT2_9ACTN|nr:glycosyltransferase [Parviterribacteraceae bacterium J379]
MEGDRPTASEPTAPRVALIHDFLLDVRGAERVFAVMCDLFPEADVFTAVYDPVGTEGRFSHRDIRTSFLQRLRPTARTFRALLPLYPYAMESMDLRGYDIVLSSSSAWAHGVLVDEDAIHVCYCHNPFRYAWNARDETLRARNPVQALALRIVFQRWRQWDWIAAQRVDRYIANSETTSRRISRYFSRDSSVLHPPVECSRFDPTTPAGDQYVVLSELMRHKRIDVAVRAFTQLGLPLTVIGKGPDLKRLRKLAGPTITFVGRVSDAEVARILQRSRALVVTATEEFGIAAVEAQAAGRPVIALRDGGLRETVIEGETGAFYETSDPAELARVIREFDTTAIDPAACRESAMRFDRTRFEAGLRREVALAQEEPAARAARSERLRAPRRVIPRGRSRA